MKKTIGILLTFTLLMTSICTVGAQNIKTLEYDNVIFEQDFSSVNGASGINGILETQTTRTDIENIGSDHGNVVKLTVGANDNMLRLRPKYILSGYSDNSYTPTNKEKAQLTLEKIEADVYFENCAEMGFVIYADNGGEYVPVSFSADGSIRAGGQPSEITYNAKTWYEMKVYLDYSNNTVTVYLGDTLLVANKDITWEPASTNNLTKRFNFYVSPNQTDGFIYIDNIKYSVPTLTEFAGRTAFSDTFETGVSTSIYEIKNCTSETATVDAERHGKVVVLHEKVGTSDDILYPRASYMGTNSADASTRKEFKHVEISIDFLVNAVARTADIYLKGASGETFTLAGINADGYIDFYQKADAYKYSANEWYTLKFDVNYETQKYDVYVNNELEFSGLNITGAGNYFYRPYLYMCKSQNDGIDLKLSIDNFKVAYKTEESKVGLFKLNKGNGVSSLHRLTVAGSDFNIYERQNGENALASYDFSTAPSVDTAGVWESNVASQFDAVNHSSVLKLYNHRMDGSTATYGKYDFYDLKTEWNMQNANSSVAIVETDICLSHITSAALRLRTRTSDNLNKSAESVLLFDDKGNICKPDGTAVGKYEEGKWYSVKAYFNHENSAAPTVTIWLDGKLLFENYALTQQGNYVGRFGVGFTSGDTVPCTIELDNFKMYADKINKIDGKNMCLIGAAYDNDELVSVSLQNAANLDQKEYGFVSVGFDTSKAPSAQKYFMIWDNLNTLKPLTKKTAID